MYTGSAAERSEVNKLMTENTGPHYFNDDGSAFSLDLQPIPDLCISCRKHEVHDAHEEIICNLTRVDQQEDAVFLCFAYQPV